MNQTIRKASLEDLEALVLLFEEYRKFYRMKADVEGATDFLKARLQHEDSVIFVAASDQVLVGFTQLYPSFSSTRMQKMWILNDLYLDPKYRGLGISKKLIKAAKTLAQTTSACGLLLETEKNNVIGNKLYLQENFHLEQNNFYFWSV